MSALTSLLVRDRVVPVSKIEEALQHQVLVGGDIETILLEMNLVPEDVLSAYRAALFGLLPATREEVMKAARDAVRKVPRELARGAGFVPLVLEGRTLVVAASEPPREELGRQIRAQLGCELAVRIVTQARLAAGLANHYGYELEPRMRRLTEALRKRDPGVIPYVKPPSPSLKPHTASHGRDSFGQPQDTLERALLPERDASSDAASRDEQAEAQELLNGLEATKLPEPAATKSGPVPRVEPSQLRVGRVAASTVPPATVSPHIARGVRGPLPAERAIELFGEAAQRDDVLFVLLRYAQQFFDFVAVFSLGKEGARGRMSHGAGLSAELMEQVVIPLVGTGLAARAAHEKRPIVGDLSASDDERAAAALLGRPAGRPGLAVPLLLRSRPVLLVYGDREGEGVSVEDAEPITAVASAVAEALRRLIVENKALKRSVRPGAAPPVVAADDPPRVDAPDNQSGGEEGPTLANPKAVTVVERPVTPDTRLTAVDLESVSRAAPSTPELRRETVPLHSAMLSPESGGASEARNRVLGVPRAAPPPPVRDSLLPPGAGSYSFVSSGGSVMEETIRPSRAQLAVAERRAPQPAPTSPQKSEPAAQVQRLRPSHPRVDDAPSVIIDMGDQVSRLVESLVRAQPNQEPPEIAELLKLGEVALPVLLQHFPGPLWFDRHRSHRRRPRGRDVSAVARAIVAFGNRAAPYVASLLGAGDPDQVYYGLMVAGELVHADLLDAVARHVLDHDDELRFLALEVLRGYTGLPQFATVVRALADLTTRPGKDPRRQRLAVEALGELRDQRALHALLARLSDPSEGIVQAAHRALVTLTAQDFGLAQRKWEAWAEQWGHVHRVEWLIESLLHSEESVRSLAGEELKQLTQQYFGYHPGLPKRDREVAQRKYREWWEREGREVFGFEGVVT